MDNYPSITPVESEPVTQDDKEPIKVNPSAPESEPILEPEYVKNFLELGETSQHFEMPSLIKEIDQFVLSEIDRQGLEKNHKSYEEIINGYLKDLKLPENIDHYTKIEKLNSLMRINKKMIEAMVEKENLMKSDPTQMSSTQLKRYINEQSKHNN
jgi:hypothetical protein